MESKINQSQETISSNFQALPSNEIPIKNSNFFNPKKLILIIIFIVVLLLIAIYSIFKK